MTRMEAVQVTETVDEASYSLEAMNLASLVPTDPKVFPLLSLGC